MLLLALELCDLCFDERLNANARLFIRVALQVHFDASLEQEGIPEIAFAKKRIVRREEVGRFETYLIIRRRRRWERPCRGRCQQGPP